MILSSDILKTLDFIPLKSFLEHYGFVFDDELVHNIMVHIFGDYPVIDDFNFNINVIKLVNKAVSTLLDTDTQNVLCLGYGKSQLGTNRNELICWYLNHANNMFKTRRWSKIFRLIGCELAEYLLTKCCVVEVINGRNVLIAGNLKKIDKNENLKNSRIHRERLFHKMTKEKRLNISEILQYIYKEDIYYDEQEQKYKIRQNADPNGHGLAKNFKINKFQYEIRAIENWIQRHNKLNVFKVYFKYFERELDSASFNNVLESQVTQTKLTNFLFIVAKKELKSMLNYHAFRILKSKIRLFVTRNRYETLGETELLRHFKINKLKLFRENNIKGRCEYLRQIKVFTNILNCIFNRIFIPLVSTYFYSTEAYQGFKVFYFTRKTWSYFTRKYLSGFLSRFEKKTKNTTTVGYNPRCIPKKEGFRVIINKSKRNKNGKSENMIYQPSYYILAAEQKHNQGNSFISYDQIFKSFIDYDLSSSFMLKFDIKGCFDNIPHANLMSALSDFLKNNEYHVRKYNLLLKSGLNYISKQKCISVDNSMDFAKMLEQKAGVNNKEIIWDSVFVNYKTKDKLIEEIAKFIKQNTIVLGKTQYVQKQGIPQGSVLSSILCSIYFQNLDKHHFNKIIRQGRIFRYVDDFIIISPNLDEIIQLVASLKVLEAEGIYVNYDKIESNFGLEHIINKHRQVTSSEESIRQVRALLKNTPDTDKMITYCGLKLCCRGIKINLNFERIDNSCAYSDIKPGQAIKFKIMRFSKRVLKRLYFLKTNNFKYQNIYDILILISRKILSYLRNLEFINIRFVLSIVNSAMNRMKRQIESTGTSVTEKKMKEIKNKALDDSGLRFFLHKIEIKKLMKRQKEIYKKWI